ncbi:hypothetical protein GS429_14755 [Natronorubrum sp. JWXQ-INN-674]|uniref:Uncharacterized protein n=1 Tax=Natronorubrum halalkaliphilum TaxID=2691917 RepID=A0A6B0VQ58_9EURY|nr:hypothetical protein [Natronorubrum halalkaliphilum]MXV63303.1 hypothetical protein [Natronorubrum halalkaliphilum]
MTEDVTTVHWRPVFLALGTVAILLYGIAFETLLLAVIAVVLLLILNVLYRIEAAVSDEQ